MYESANRCDSDSRNVIAHSFKNFFRFYHDMLVSRVIFYCFFIIILAEAPIIATICVISSAVSWAMKSRPRA